MDISGDGRRNEKEMTVMKMEERICQGELESSIASNNDLITHREALADTRMTKMSTIMKEGDRQTVKIDSTQRLGRQ